MPPTPENNYQAGPTDAFSRIIWNAVMQSIAQRLAAREALEADFEALIEQGTQAALDLIQVNVGPQLETLTEQIDDLEEQLAEILGGGTAANSLNLGGQAPSYYLALANATGTLPVAKVTGVDALIAAAVAGLVNSAPGALDTLKELADALGGDANFAATVSAALGARLIAASNLSDLANAATARANLGANANGSDIFTGATAIGKLLATALDAAAARSALGANSNGSDILTGASATGRSLGLSADAAAARTTLGAPALPKTGTGVGQLLAIQEPFGSGFIFPTGGTWMLWANAYDTSNVWSGNSTVQVAAGGTPILPGLGGSYRWVGFAWRIA